MQEGPLLTNSIIESLGAYLPPKIVSTADIRRACKTPIALPIERLTGVRNRRVAGEDTFSIDLAKRAIDKCLAVSRHQPGDIDLLISSNMSRYDGPNFHYTFEPSTSIRLKKHFGFDRALTFDVTNACAGMFTALKVADAMLKAGMIGVAMVVSGEYITHLTQTAQREITDYKDHRLACLTLGDSGVALILERAPREGPGFHAIDLYTAGAYCRYGVARPSDEEHGGAIMFTDSIRLHEVAIRSSAEHIVRTLRKVRWGKDDLNHVIIHQTSHTAFHEAARQVNALVEDTYCHDDNMLDNLAERGNTATTTHLLATWDQILNGRIKSGDNVLFAIQASGLTIGSAPYTFDDLPDRIRRAECPEPDLMDHRPPAGGRAQRTPETQPRIRIESLGIAAPTDAAKDGMTLVQTAMERCLERSSYGKDDIALLMYAGVYRDGFLGEPAMAAMIADRVKLNENGVATDGKQTFAFDLSNGAIGFLQACYAAVGFVQSRTYENVMVVAYETENNARIPGNDLLGIAEAGSAMIINASPGGSAGFGSFVFRSFDDYLTAFSSWLVQAGGQTGLSFFRLDNIEHIFLQCIPQVVDEVLAREGLRKEDIQVVLPPQISATFVPRLRQAISMPGATFVDLTARTRDLYSSTMAHTLRYVEDEGWGRSGDIGLIINAGSGIQVGCAIYYF